MECLHTYVKQIIFLCFNIIETINIKNYQYLAKVSACPIAPTDSPAAREGRERRHVYYILFLVTFISKCDNDPCIRSCDFYISASICFMTYFVWMYLLWTMLLCPLFWYLNER